MTAGDAVAFFASIPRERGIIPDTFQPGGFGMLHLSSRGKATKCHFVYRVARSNFFFFATQRSSRLCRQKLSFFYCFSSKKGGRRVNVFPHAEKVSFYIYACLLYQIPPLA